MVKVFPEEGGVWVWVDWVEKIHLPCEYHPLSRDQKRTNMEGKLVSESWDSLTLQKYIMKCWLCV